MEDVKFLIKNDECETWGFTNLSRIAKFLDTQQSYVNYCMRNMKPCKGWEVVIADGENNFEINDDLTLANFVPVSYKINPTKDFYHLYEKLNYVLNEFGRTCCDIRSKCVKILENDGIDKDTAIHYVVSLDDINDVIDCITGFDIDKIRSKYNKLLIDSAKDSDTGLLGFDPKELRKFEENNNEK